MQDISRKDERRFDIVVWGATGFTGRLVVEYLLERYPVGGDLRWAVAGRNEHKLATLIDEMAGTADKPPLLVADSHDAASLDALALAAKVVLTTVGPYAKYGSELVAACVRNGTHYCDLCGEVQWMRQMIDQHQTAAGASGARIVMSCGFDSIPSDFGVWYLQRQAEQLHGQRCERATLLVRAMQGGASGGTIASLLNAVAEAQRDKAVAKILRDPYALNPAAIRSGPRHPDQTKPVYHTATGYWTAPFVMASVNTRVVRRTQALLSQHAEQAYFQYHEATITGRGIAGRAKAIAMCLALGTFFAASTVSTLRNQVLPRLLPSPGEGPTETERTNGYYNLLLVGQMADNSILRLRIKGDRDPGYGSTSKMLAESAVCLAKDDLTSGGGCWTPVSAMGEALFKRLTANAGLSFQIEA